MSESEEIKTTDKVITEEIVQVAEEVTEKLEKIAEETDPNASTTTTTVITEVANVVTELIGLKMISESNLSEDQKKLASTIYESVKPAVEGFISDPNVNNTVKITKVIGQVIKQLENTKIEGKVITGADKKIVAIQLGRILIKEVTPDDKGEAEILMVYDLIAEPTLEAMIEVSKVVNVAIQEMATKCCPGLLEFFKRVKKTA